jgi:hypothetical protein
VWGCRVHGDGDPGLGLDVASLMLGGSPHMNSYMKPDWECGKTGSKELKLVLDNPFLLGCQKGDESLILRRQREKTGLRKANNTSLG